MQSSSFSDNWLFPASSKRFPAQNGVPHLSLRVPESWATVTAAAPPPEEGTREREDQLSPRTPHGLPYGTWATLPTGLYGVTPRRPPSCLHGACIQEALLPALSLNLVQDFPLTPPNLIPT